MFHSVSGQSFVKSPNIEGECCQQQYQNNVEKTKHNCNCVNLTLQTLSGNLKMSAMNFFPRSMFYVLLPLYPPHCPPQKVRKLSL